MESLKEQIAIFLRERRLELNLTMEELAILIYNNPKMKTQVSAFETGKRSPSLDTLELFLKALKTELVLNKE